MKRGRDRYPAAARKLRWGRGRRLAPVSAAAALILLAVGGFGCSAAGLTTVARYRNPPGAVRLGKGGVKRVGKILCGKPKSGWTPGSILPSGYFVSDAQQARNDTALAARATSKIKARYLALADLYARRAKQRGASCLHLDDPPGAVKLPAASVKRAGAIVCGKLGRRWGPGALLKSGYFISDAQQARNYRPLAKRSKGRTKGRYLALARMYGERAKKNQTACTKAGAPAPPVPPVPPAPPVPPVPPNAPGSVTVAAVGDIAGGATNATDVAVKERVVADHPAAVLMLGDYDNGASPAPLSAILANTDGIYGPKPGGLYPLMHPTPGPTHDVSSCTNQAGYPAYWGRDPTKPYSFDIPIPGGRPWHVLSIPSIVQTYGCGVQAITDWINADLTAHPALCSIAYWHEPYFTSSTSGHSEASLSGTKPWVHALYDHHVSILIGGHQNGDFMAFYSQTPDKVRNDARGIQAFVAATGGQSPYSITGTAPNLITQRSGVYGPLVLTLHDGSYDWKFDQAVGSGYSPSGNKTCR